MSTTGEFATIADLLSATVTRALAGGDPDCRRPASATVLDRVDDLVLVLDTQGNVRAVNRACAETAGQPCDEARGTPFWDLFAVPDEQDSFRAMVRMVAESGAPCQFDGHLRVGHGDPPVVNWSLREICDSAGLVQRILLIGKLLDRESAPALGRTGAERRTSPRRGYRDLQSIAPWNGETMPRARDFFDVPCQDISGGGFSFFVGQRPEFEDIVVALGKLPNVIHFTAHVRRVREWEADGRKGYLVGCQFRGRVHL
jgi:PAS domain S-box-containing protein